LEVNIHNNNSLINKQLVVTQRIDGMTVYTDTLKIKKTNFLLKLPFEGPALLDVNILESNVYNIMMASEKGKIQLNIEGTKPYFSGTPINDRLQAFYLGNDSVFLLSKEYEKEYDLLRSTENFTPKVKEEFDQKLDQLLSDNTDRIIAFIKENIDNPIGEYYFSINYITFIPERKAELRSFASEKLKKEFRFE
jgi:hypothetical protein